MFELFEIKRSSSVRKMIIDSNRILNILFDLGRKYIEEISLIELIKSNKIKKSIFLLQFIILNLFILRCNCEKYYVPSLENFEFCSDGFRVLIHSIEPYNGSSGI